MASMASLVLHPSSVARFHVNQASIVPRLHTPTPILFQCRSSKLILALRSVDEGLGSAAAADSDSVVSEVAALPSEEKEEKEAQLKAENGVSNLPEEKSQVENGNGVKDSKPRRPSVLQRGGTLVGDEAAGKDPNPAALGKKTAVAVPGASFSDPRWRNGNWDLAQFTKDGKVDWDAVIDAEVRRRKWLEEEPEASSNSEPVVFETSMVPWWAWVKRFHLPEAELVNGRAAMVGFFAAYLVDAATGIGLVDQMGSFLGKLLLFITVVGILLIRKNEDATKLKKLADEWTFYDKQWQATWKDQEQAPAEKEQQ